MAVDGDLAGHDVGAGAGAGLYQAAIDEEDVEAFFVFWHIAIRNPVSPQQKQMPDEETGFLDTGFLAQARFPIGQRVSQ
ncbi:protein of unknown function [Candidatus Promineifilum breve]|uniref:Uncharacterized protein n=1 Tax=Candidatus Promineifilum breve TaxID=1806508 RepID=A0A161KA24_9CHLR|nr:protein of unknown function [Candidatus Promineifilum breve]